MGPWSAWTNCVPTPVPALLLPFLHQGARRGKQPGTRKHFFDQPGLLQVTPGPSRVTSDPCSPGHPALYFQYYSPAHLAGASQYPIPSDCHLRATLSSMSLTPAFPRALPSSVLPTHHTCDCPHTGLFPFWHMTVTCTSPPSPSSSPSPASRNGPSRCPPFIFTFLPGRSVGGEGRQNLSP